jgi:hypothetical protein
MLDRVLACAQLNERNRIRHGQDLFGCNVGDFDTKLIFERHDEFDRVKAVCPQLIDEAAVVGHFALLYTQVLHDDFFYQGLDNQLIVATSKRRPTYRRIESRSRLGGMLRFYERAAA